MNPILQTGRLAQVMPMVNQVKQMMGFLRTAQNPSVAMNELANQNKDLKEVMDMVNGKNPQDVFYSKCQEMGVNPDVILGMLR